jgi:hypothetical protein
VLNLTALVIPLRKKSFYTLTQVWHYREMMINRSDAATGLIHRHLRRSRGRRPRFVNDESGLLDDEPRDSDRSASVAG